MVYMIHIYLVSFIYLVLYLLFTFGLSHFTFISHRGRPEDDTKRFAISYGRPLTDVFLFPGLFSSYFSIFLNDIIYSVTKLALIIIVKNLMY